VIGLIGAILAACVVFFRSRRDMLLEVLALCQQVAVPKRKRRLVLSSFDRLFWVMLRIMWPRWSDALANREASHRNRVASNRLPTLLAMAIQAPGGRPMISREVRGLIRKMRLESADWGAPKIHGEVLELGFNISETHDRQVSPTPVARTGKPE
jgi:putative transposase